LIQNGGALNAPPKISPARFISRLASEEIAMLGKLSLLILITMIATAYSLHPPLAAEAAPQSAWRSQRAPGFYRFRLGDFRVTVLSDGIAVRDLSKIMSKPAVVREAYAASHQPLPVALSINCYLIDTGAQQILVDTGAGEIFGRSAGYLVENLRAAGYDPEDIDNVLLTHIHADHSGGLSVGGKLVFPNALVYVDQRDPALWLSQDASARAPRAWHTTFTQSHQTMDPVVRAGKLRRFNGGNELFPGIRSVPEYGHTPGHSGYLVKSRGQRLLVWGDVVHSAEVQFKHPIVTIAYDVDPAEAVRSRRRALREAAQQGYLVGGAHLSFPGLGHVRLDSCGYAWAPIPYGANDK
jgi:glyoxylase-like metal-dependent hydrolase (beta-lactamase superfamily II)